MIYTNIVHFFSPFVKGFPAPICEIAGKKQKFAKNLHLGASPARAKTFYLGLQNGGFRDTIGNEIKKGGGCVTGGKELPIAVMDSGVGGISVLCELVKQLPAEDFLYFGDSGNAPYGGRSREEVLALTRAVFARLRARGIKAFVIACNTATSAAAAALRAEAPDLPILGIEPAVKPATLLGAHPNVLVMATPLTLKEEKFGALAARFADVAQVIPCPAAGLVELIEAGVLAGEALHTRLSKIFAPFAGQRVDAVVLGCTHYPHIRDAIAAHFPAGTPILDGGEGTARHTRRRLAALDLLRDSDRAGVVEFYNSSEDETLLALSRDLFERGMKAENK